MAKTIKRIAKVNEYITFKTFDDKEVKGKVFAIYNNSVGVMLERSIYVNFLKGFIDKTIVNHKRYRVVKN